MALTIKGSWQQIHTFIALIEYLLTAIRYQAYPCSELLTMLGQDPRFADEDLKNCQTFADIKVPVALGRVLQQEARQTLVELGGAPYPRACDLLGRLLSQCQKQEQTIRQKADDAWRLYPKLGLCIGLLFVLLFL